MSNVLITGAGSGIGAGLTTGLAARGHHLFVTDANRGAAQGVAEQVIAAGLSAEAVALDVTSDDSVAAAMASLSRPVDVLVNNAGLQRVAPLEEFPIVKWEQLIQVMLIGAARLMRAVLPGMRARGFGRIVNMGSIHSLVASPYKSAYVAAKHGLVGLSKSVALETADVDITVNTICPSYVKTPLVIDQISSQAEVRGIAPEAVIQDVMLKPMPKGAFITTDELVEMTAWLMSGAARNVTGQTLVIDGGWTAQ